MRRVSLGERPVRGPHPVGRTCSIVRSMRQDDLLRRRPVHVACFKRLEHHSEPTAREHDGRRAGTGVRPRRSARPASPGSRRPGRQGSRRHRRPTGGPDARLRGLADRVSAGQGIRRCSSSSSAVQASGGQAASSRCAISGITASAGSVRPIRPPSEPQQSRVRGRDLERVAAGRGMCAELVCDRLLLRRFRTRRRTARGRPGRRRRASDRVDQVQLELREELVRHDLAVAHHREPVIDERVQTRSPQPALLDLLAPPVGVETCQCCAIGHSTLAPWSVAIWNR